MSSPSSSSALKIHAHPNHLQASLLFLYPYPRLLTATLTLTTMALLFAYNNSDFTILECTRHSSPQQSNLQSVEDNDCELKKTVPILPTNLLTTFSHNIGIDVTREFLFELSSISVSLTASNSEPNYYQISPQKSLTELKGRSIKSSVDAHDETHYHSQITVPGEIGKSYDFEYTKNRKNPILKRSSTCQILLESNERRLYTYNTYFGYTNSLSCVERASEISAYLETAKLSPTKKMHLDISEDASFVYLLLSCLVGIGSFTSLLLKGWERLTVDASTSTLTLTTGSSIYVYSRDVYIRKGSRVCSLDTLAGVRVKRRVILVPGRSNEKKFKWQLEIKLSGVGIERMVDTTSTATSTTDMECDIDFGSPLEEKEEGKRAATAINGVIQAFGGGEMVEMGEGFFDESGENGTNAAGGEDNNNRKLIGLQTSPIRRTNASNTTQLNDIARSSLCVICMAKRSCVVFKPCRHLRCCGSCAERVDKCPICRKKIEEREFVYV